MKKAIIIGIKILIAYGAIMAFLLLLIDVLTLTVFGRGPTYEAIILLIPYLGALYLSSILLFPVYEIEKIMGLKFRHYPFEIVHIIIFGIVIVGGLILITVLSDKNKTRK